MKEFDEIEQLFQDTFHEFEMIPDASVKRLIDARIAQPKRKRRFLIWFFPILVAFGVLGYTGYVNNMSGVSKNYDSSNKQFSKDLKEKKSEDSLTAKANNSTQIDSKLAKKYIDNQSSVNEIKAIKTTTMSKGKERGVQNNTIYRNKVNNLNRSRSPKQVIPNQQKVDDEHVATKPIIPELMSRSNKDLEETKDIKHGSDDPLMIELQEDTTKNQALDPKSNPSIPEVPHLKKSWLTVHWSLSGVAGFETGKVRSKIPSSIEGNQNQQYEFANIDLKAFYGKLEATKVIDNRFNLLLGIGYKSSTISQFGTVFVKDSMIEASILVPTSYFYEKMEGRQDFKINSVLIPIGLTYQIFVRKKFVVQTSLYGEMSFANFRQSGNDLWLSEPEFSRFGFQASLRPEFHYRLRKSSIFTFGSVGKTFRNHLNWDFTAEKPWVFGGGVGWKYEFLR